MKMSIVMTARNFGMTEDDISSISNILGLVLSPNTHQAMIFGSRASNQAARFSDFDILIRGPLDPEMKADLEDAFENSDFPYLVDLVREDDLSARFRAVALNHVVEVPINKPE